ncbi:MAG: DUF4115 domain-containing protein [Deltaproteobacteria bacterium]|jgi:cytoskeletal protein RodZ|nr:DUF4115 domain-containing protein [Deltaproteobacteria bacterium]
MQVDKLMDLGTRLREKRESLGLEREDIAVKIKVSAKTLYALEEALVDSLPQPIFARGFIQAYAEAVGIGPGEINDLIAATFPSDSLYNINPGLSSSAREQSITINQTSNAKAALIVVPFLLLFAALALGIYYFFGEDIKELLGGGSSADTQQSGSLHAGAVASPLADEAGGGELVESGGADSSSQTRGLVAEAGPGEAPAEAEPEVETAFLPSAGQSSPQFTVVRQSNARANSPIPPGSMRVVLFAKDECWVGAEFDNSGTRGFSLEAGQTFVLDFKDRLKLTLGNSGVVEMSYNGRPYNIGGRFREARVLHFP